VKPGNPPSDRKFSSLPTPESTAQKLPGLSASNSSLLSIAGFDPTSGAGVTADVKTFETHGFNGASCITAITVQTTRGVSNVLPISAEIVGESLNLLAGDNNFSAVKIGMLGTAEMVAEVAKFLRKRQDFGGFVVVCDPIIRSSSGHALLDEAGVELMRRELLPLVDWVTPNMDELRVLLRGSEGEVEVDAEAREVKFEYRDDVAEVRRATAGAARALQEMVGAGSEARAGRLNVVVTGGHGARPDDFLLTAVSAGHPAGEEHWFPGEWVESAAGQQGFHGTGCAFSSALAANLGKGLGPVAAVAAAKAYVTGAIRNARRVGGGAALLDHFWEKWG